LLGTVTDPKARQARSRAFGLKAEFISFAEPKRNGTKEPAVADQGSMAKQATGVDSR
jgi:hypothetical protein